MDWLLGQAAQDLLGYPCFGRFQEIYVYLHAYGTHGRMDSLSFIPLKSLILLLL
jgi:hypothetical protein